MPAVYFPRCLIDAVYNVEELLSVFPTLLGTVENTSVESREVSEETVSSDVHFLTALCTAFPAFPTWTSTRRCDLFAQAPGSGRVIF